MNNPQYLAQVGHTLAGCLALVVAALFWGMPGVWPTLVALVAAAAIKEFWYDLRYELPKQTLADSGMDFAFYLVGGALGLGLACVKFYLL
jgi:hypothetical protein